VVWPAAHPAVIAVQGDARCRRGDWSWLDLPHAQFGADPSPSRPGAPAGASVAAARFAGLLLAALSRMPAPAARQWMRTQAAYVGREHRDGGDSR